MAERNRDIQSKPQEAVRAEFVHEIMCREFPDTDMPKPAGNECFWQTRQDAQEARRAELQALSIEALRRLVEERRSEADHLWKLFDQADSLEKDIRQWNDTPANGVTELAQKEQRLTELRERLAAVQKYLNGRRRGRAVLVSDIMISNMQQVYDRLDVPSMREVANITGYSRNSASFKAAWERLKK